MNTFTGAAWAALAVGLTACGMLSPATMPGSADTIGFGEDTALAWTDATVFAAADGRTFGAVGVRVPTIGAAPTGRSTAGGLLPMTVSGTATSSMASLDAPPTGALSSNPQTVAEVQRLLTILGYAPGALDGRLDTATARALARYQTARGLATDRPLDGPLLAHLRADAFPAAPKRMGPLQSVGGGPVAAYVEYAPDGRPIAVGVAIGRATLDTLPATVTDPRRCADLDRNGGLDPVAECLAIGEVMLALPEPSAGGPTLPFRWIGLNWLPQGLRTVGAAADQADRAFWPAAWAAPHLGVHFYLQDYDAVQAIGPGRCGGLVDCRHHRRAIAPLPPAQLPPGYVNVGGVLPHMGNHLADALSPAVLRGDPDSFEHGLAIGTYDGALTFFEPMVAPAYLLQGSDRCFAISQPADIVEGGLYPTAYCLRERPELGGVTVSLEGLIERVGASGLVARR